MSLKRLPSPFHRRSLLQRRPRVAGRLGYGPSAFAARQLLSQEPLDGALKGEEFEREVEKARELALEISWPLRRAEERLDSTLHRIDSTLQELATQRERTRRLEHALGIER
jgi:hypothetical protein